MRSFFLNGGIARSAIRTGAVLGARVVAQAATLLLLAYFLGPQALGIYVGGGALAVLIGTMATFGTHLALLRDVSRNLDVDGALSRALGTTRVCSVALFIFYLVVVCALFPALSKSVWLVLCIGLSEIVIQPFLLIAAMDLHGRGRVASSQLLLVQPLLLRLLFISVLGYLPVSDRLNWYALCHLLAALLPLLFVICQASASLWRRPNCWKFAERSRWRELSGYAFMGVSANGVAELDKIAAARFLPADAAGIYSAGSRIVGSLVMPVIALVLVAMPSLFRFGGQRSLKLYYWLLVVAGLYGLLAAFGVSAAANWIESLLGSNYEGVGKVVLILACSVPAVCLRATAMNLLTTLEKPWMRVGFEIMGWCLITGLAYSFSRLGIHSGLALAVVVAEWLLASVVVFSVMTAAAVGPVTLGEVDRSE